MLRDNPPPPHATHLTSAFGPAVFAKASATIALVQVRNALKALQPGVLSPVSPELIIQNAEANLQILERALGVEP